MILGLDGIPDTPLGSEELVIAVPDRISERSRHRPQESLLIR